MTGTLILSSEIHVGWMVPGNPWEAMHRLGPKGLLLGAELLWADDAVEAAWADGSIISLFLRGWCLIASA